MEAVQPNIYRRLDTQVIPTPVSSKIQAQFDEVLGRGSIVFGSQSQHELLGGGNICATVVARALIALFKGEKFLDVDSLLKQGLSDYLSLIHYLRETNITNAQEQYDYNKPLTWEQDVMPKEPPFLFPELIPLSSMNGTVYRDTSSDSFRKMLEDLASQTPFGGRIGACLMIGGSFYTVFIKKEKGFECHFIDSHKCEFLKNKAYQVCYRGEKSINDMATFLALRFNSYFEEKDQLPFYLHSVLLNENVQDTNRIPPISDAERAAFCFEIALKPIAEESKKTALKSAFSILHGNLKNHSLYSMLVSRLDDYSISLAQSKTTTWSDRASARYHQQNSEIERDPEKLIEKLMKLSPNTRDKIITLYIDEVLRKEFHEKCAKKVKQELEDLTSLLRRDFDNYKNGGLTLRQERAAQLLDLQLILDNLKKHSFDTASIEDLFLDTCLSYFEGVIYLIERNETISADDKRQIGKLYETLKNIPTPLNDKQIAIRDKIVPHIEKMSKNSLQRVIHSEEVNTGFVEVARESLKGLQENLVKLDRASLISFYSEMMQFFNDTLPQLKAAASSTGEDAHSFDAIEKALLGLRLDYFDKVSPFMKDSKDALENEIFRVLSDYVFSHESQFKTAFPEKWRKISQYYFEEASETTVSSSTTTSSSTTASSDTREMVKAMLALLREESSDLSKLKTNLTELFKYLQTNDPEAFKKLCKELIPLNLTIRYIESLQKSRNDDSHPLKTFLSPYGEEIALYIQAIFEMQRSDGKKLKDWYDALVHLRAQKIGGIPFSEEKNDIPSLIMRVTNIPSSKERIDLFEAVVEAALKN